MRHRAQLIGATGLAVWIGISASPAAQKQRPTAALADRAEAAAVEAAARGDFPTAIAAWTEAARVHGKGARNGPEALALVALADSQQAIGDYTHAKQSLARASALAARLGDETLAATVGAASGNLAVTTDPKSAEGLLTAARSIAERRSADGLTATIETNLGNLFAVQRRFDDALNAYEKSARLASGSPALAARALGNRGRVAIDAGRWDVAADALTAALALAERSPDTHDKALTLTQVGRALAQLLPQAPGQYAVLRVHAERAFTSAAALAKAIDDPLARSYALGYYGSLCESEGRRDEASTLTRQALVEAARAQQRVGAFAVDDGGTGTSGAVGSAVYRWHWQIARILAARGLTEEAIAAARRAADVLQEIRFEVTTSYGGGQQSFRQAVEPVYLFLVDLLLQQSRRVADSPQRTSLILEARRRVEILKAAELRDYFDDDCVDALLAAAQEAGSVDPLAAVIYPILLPDRVELLVDAPAIGGVQALAVAVGREQLTHVVNEFRRELELPAAHGYLPHAQQLYAWLIRPLDPLLTAAYITTLIFVPDGPLRTVPMAALHDGQHFLIERFAVAAIPGLTLVDPRPLPRNDVRVLLAGLSRPSEKFAPLPYVAAELNGIHALFPSGAVLLNDSFTRSRLQRSLEREPYSIVHIASHGVFASDRGAAYLLVNDQALSMDDLASFIRVLRFRGLPSADPRATTSLELLVLSACETAEGDERAALGLSGLAVAAGARSAVGTLWNVNDSAAADLIVRFYTTLKSENVSKAEALRRAQRALLEDVRFEHPKYWAAFLLISNWL